MNRNYAVVGKPLQRVDGKVKVTGEGIFAADVMLPNMLHGKILRSPHPHARIVGINTSNAEALAGVKAVVTGKEIGPIRFAFVDTPRYPADQYPLAIDKVRFVGDEVAAVAAVDEATAAEALELIEVEYELMPAVFDPLEAMKDGAPQIHTEIVPTTTCSWEDWGVKKAARPYKVKNNICAEVSIRYGDAEKAFAESDYVREDRFFVPATAHAAMEPHVIVASYDTDSDKLDIWISHMSLAVKQYWLSKTLGIPQSKVRIHSCFTGGTFGGKIELFSHDFLAAYLSKKTGRPVKIVTSRHEVFTNCRLSHRFIIDLKTGVKKDGKIMAMHAKVINDPGAYRGSSPVVMFLTHAFRSPLYNIPNGIHEGVGVYTNKPVCMPKRGHGSPQMSFAAEQQLDMIAEYLGLDAAELRLKNVRKEGDVLPNGDRLDSCGLTTGIQRAVEVTDWKEKRGKGREQFRGIGMGLSGMFSGSMYHPFHSAGIVRLNMDGTATVYSGQSEFGQGTTTVMSQIAAEELGLCLHDVQLVSGDSEVCPPDIGGFLSAGVFCSGEAVRRAAADAKKQLLQAASEILEEPTDGLEVKDGRIYVSADKERGQSFVEIVRYHVQKHNGDSMIGRGYVKPVPEVEFYPSLSRGGSRFTDAYGLTVAVAEVEVNPETGRAKVLKVTVADDCGQHINPKNVYGQLISQAAMAVGDALFEEVVVDEQGRIANPSFDDYKIAGVHEMPEFAHVGTDTHEPKGPFGGKEVGENARAAIIAAIANAVFDAIGARINTLPLTPERILKAMEGLKK
jgi:CO/xanthine dehydrogenase Mo-binding subunit